MWQPKKLCVIGDSRSCTRSKTTYRLKIRLLHHFDTHLTIHIFANYMYYKYFDFNISAIALQPSGNEQMSHFPNLIKNYRVAQFLWCEKSDFSFDVGAFVMGLSQISFFFSHSS